MIFLVRLPRINRHKGRKNLGNHGLTDRALVSASILASLIFLHTQAQTEASNVVQPNVLVILTDDQGWGDLSLNGNENLSTPNIDSIANAGATLNHFYVCQVCAPTRAEFLTGRYYPRTGVSGVSIGQERLNPDETTIADLLSSAGYATGIFGKWHNGTQSPYHPNDRGFGEFYGFTSGHWGHYFSPPLEHNRESVRGTGFVVDDFTNRALEFIHANQDGPFFCYLPLNTPHSPMMVPDRFYQKFSNSNLSMRHRDPGREDLAMTRAALAMMENVDWNVGRVLDLLLELELEENTIVIFFSDNGPNSFRWNGGMKGKKGSIDEGGLRSPCLIRWPKQIPPGSLINQISGAIDLLPTVIDLVGLEAPPSGKAIDGLSMAPWLRGERLDTDYRTLFSIKNDQVSVRRGEYRLDDSKRLFNVVQDPRQDHDLSKIYPKLTEELHVLASEHREVMKQCFARYAERPFTVGYHDKTVLPARDGVAHGSVSRSSKSPNNSFFENWTDRSGELTWEIQVAESGVFDVVLHYTCREVDVGATIAVNLDEAGQIPGLTYRITKPFDPPLYDKSKERVKKSHYQMKDFARLSLGKMKFPEGKAILRLSALEIPGDEVIDVHSIELIRAND